MGTNEQAIWFSVECSRNYAPGERYSNGSGIHVATQDETRARDLFSLLRSSPHYTRTVTLRAAGSVLDTFTVGAR